MSVEREMPKYQSIKKVWALKIKEIYPKFTGVGQESDGSMWMSFHDDNYDKISISHEYLRKHNPIAGGYYVVYEDGYKSFSPAVAFEKGNVLIK